MKLLTKTDETADGNSDDIVKLQGDLSTANNTIKALQATCASLHDNIKHQDTYSRRDNLLFEKVPEIEGEVWTEVICQMFLNNLKWERVGKPQKDSPRIICRFLYFGDGEQV